MTALRTLLALTYVAAQLTHRWLPPPADEEDACALWERTWSGLPELEKLGERVWLDLVAWAWSDGAAICPWTGGVERRYGGAGREALARAASSHFRALTAAEAGFLALSDPEYPALLRALTDPPLGLTYQGDVQLLSRSCVSVVGSRKASALAMRESFTLGRMLAEAGCVVVSGGAFGCDIAAHHGVLALGLLPVPAICVFAGGLARLYPRGNDAVFQRLGAGHGLFLSERLWEATCRPVDFSARNRIIAGLAPLTVVMQAARCSGALVTARFALDQGREVAVLKHPPGDVRADGSEALLIDGAMAFASATELIKNLNNSNDFNDQI